MTFLITGRPFGVRAALRWHTYAQWLSMSTHWPDIGTLQRYERRLGKDGAIHARELLHNSVSLHPLRRGCKVVWGLNTIAVTTVSHDWPGIDVSWTKLCGCPIPLGTQAFEDEDASSVFSRCCRTAA